MKSGKDGDILYLGSTCKGERGASGNQALSSTMMAHVGTDSKPHSFNTFKSVPVKCFV